MNTFFPYNSFNDNPIVVRGCFLSISSLIILLHCIFLSSLEVQQSFSGKEIELRVLYLLLECSTRTRLLSSAVFIPSFLSPSSSDSVSLVLSTFCISVLSLSKVTQGNKCCNSVCRPHVSFLCLFI